jgi:hypothetical protein
MRNILCLNKGLLWALIGLLSAAVTTPAAETTAEVTPFNGTDLLGWRKPTGDWRVVKSVAMLPPDNKKLALEEGAGVLVNGAGGRTINLHSQFEHGDVDAHIEFCIPKSSNSGIYFMGRYEIQIFDSYGTNSPTYSDCGGIYQRWKGNQGYEGHAPRVNASKPAGTWQTCDVIFRAPRFDAGGKKVQNAKFIKVMLNGKLIHENVEVTGPTRSSTWEYDERATGPLMLQGDHGPVAFRNLVLKPVTLP